ncbi:CDK-activating kinase assembly factor MAT1-domain-containing protein [Pseudomassariella vexata]|uniref:RNA polymerase II transcription factor B subunit 3 n=1 Tax=Pseudomassariella vexata TaxID=1141098 RepID=A0A1Y2DFC0_9PEZI|nr:CDK-activating kinase assembly factor MAT1-domain-containing protein [Pseudomassariella vexata]ORY57897.1 CDK-activating kinase assembly factor MAT1-domain-containing protein [Pseudomassariella vexata]
MSRKPTTNSRGSNGAPSTALPSDICPVCKRVRYLNTDMRFLINPECYHPMCSNCVTNIFKTGPAQCPYATCNQTLRFKGFRESFFSDLGTEREVDLRRRVEAVFNMTQDDFETLRDWNNYLQDKEDLIFALVYGDDDERRKADDEVLAYELKNKAEIEKNRKKAGMRESERKKMEADARAAAEARRLEELRDEERAKAEEASLNQEVMEALARGEPGSAAEIQDRILAAKKAKIAQLNPSMFALTASKQSSLLSIRGLKPKKNDQDEDESKPYDPLMGLRMEPQRYVLHDRYENSFLDLARTRDDHRIPGYSVDEYVSRSMFEAFAGLGIVIEDDKDTRQKPAAA